MIILTILKVIGIVLLLFLFLILVLLSLILFVPVRYKGNGTKKDNPDTMCGELHFTWLFHLIHGTIQYNSDGLHWTVKLLGFTVLDDREEETAYE